MTNKSKDSRSHWQLEIEQMLKNHILPIKLFFLKKSSKIKPTANDKMWGNGQPIDCW